MKKVGRKTQFAYYRTLVDLSKSLYSYFKTSHNNVIGQAKSALLIHTSISSVQLHCNKCQ